MTLEGKIGLVTGSTKNIGKAIALRLAQDGADMFIHHAPFEKPPEDVAEEVRAMGRRAWIIRGNIGSPEQIAGMFEQVATEAGRLDILVNSAAMGDAKSALEITHRQWDRTLNVSARSVLLCSQHAAKLMTSGWGRIVNISSLGSRRYLPDYVAIGASKAVVENLTRSLAVELAPRGILVNCVCGGIIKTSALDHLGPTMARQKEEYIARCPLHRLGEPEDLARVVSFLCSDDARWIMGQTIVADGGYSLW